MNGRTSQSWHEPRQSQDLVELYPATIPRESHVPDNIAEKAGLAIGSWGKWLLIWRSDSLLGEFTSGEEK